MVSAISFYESPSHYGKTRGSNPQCPVLRRLLLRKAALQVKNLRCDHAVFLRQDHFERR